MLFAPQLYKVQKSIILSEPTSDVFGRGPGWKGSSLSDARKTPSRLAQLGLEGTTTTKLDRTQLVLGGDNTFNVGTHT